MPELPEAETIARALQGALTGRTITRVQLFSPRLRTPLTPLLDARLEGRRITGVRRRGRYVILPLDDGRGLLLHFGMSGVVRVTPPDTPPRRKHEHLFVHLDDGNAIRFEDPRRFGQFECLPLNDQGYPAVLDALGPEPLGPDFTGEYLYRASRKRRPPAKVFVMDNAVVTGIGNIYATEALFRAGVSPTRPAEELTLPQCQRFVDAAREILQRAIAAGGTTIADFRAPDDSAGAYVEQLQCYGREGQPCPKCGTPLAAVKLGGRTSAYCPKCQK